MNQTSFLYRYENVADNHSQAHDADHTLKPCFIGFKGMYVSIVIDWPFESDHRFIHRHSDLVCSAPEMFYEASVLQAELWTVSNDLDLHKVAAMHCTRGVIWPEMYGQIRLVNTCEQTVEQSEPSGYLNTHAAQ